MKYRIKWGSLINDTFVYGPGKYSETDAKQRVKNLSSVSLPIVHSIEPVEDTNEIQNNLDSDGPQD